MAETPLVSICIPVYNASSFIKETLASVISQSYPNTEIVVVDDFSNDNTVEIIQSIKDSRVKLYKNEVNIGPTNNWNKSIELASGEFIKIMGGDDLLDRDCIKQQIEILLSQPIKLVASHKYVINSKSKRLMLKKTFPEGLIKGIEAFTQSMLSGSNLIGEPVAGLFRKSDFYNAGKYSSEFQYLIDLDLWYRLIGNGYLYVIAKPLYSFRVSKNSLTSVLKDHQIYEFEKFRSKLIEAGYISLNGHDILFSRFNTLIKGVIRNIVVKFT